MTINELLNQVLNHLDDLKAVNVTPLDVRTITPIADYIVIATGNSSRHIHAMRQHLVRHMKAYNMTPRGVEEDQDDEWVLVDFGDVVVHLMQPRVRDFYNLEKLWTPHTEDEKKVATA